MKFSIKDSFGKCDQSAGNCGFGHIFWRNSSRTTSFFMQWRILLYFACCLLVPISRNYAKILTFCENSFVFTLMVTSFFKNRCFSFRCYLLYLLQVLFFFKRLFLYRSSLQSLVSQTIITVLLMVYSSVFVSFVFNLGWASFTGSPFSIFSVAIILFDILRM